jgi:predicted ATPase
MRLLTESLEALKAGRHHILALPLSADLAEMFAQVGKLEDARSTIEAITSHDEQCGRSWYTPELLRVSGAIRAVAEGPDSRAASDLLRRALDLARQQSALSWELRIATTIARNMHAVGHSGEAAAQLGSVYDQFEEGHSTPDLQRAARLLGVLKAA